LIESDGKEENLRTGIGCFVVRVIFGFAFGLSDTNLQDQIRLCWLMFCTLMWLAVFAFLV